MIGRFLAGFRQSAHWRAWIVFLAAGPAGSASLLADDSANQLTLTDLAAYHAALSGKATAENARDADPPAAVSFRDLWDRTEAFRGRRVSVRGRIERIFRQGPVGQFPALVQAWTFSPSGDPFCLVYAAPGTDSKPGNLPGLGAEIQFVGTFLKVVEYPAGDGSRLAPLIVGELPPEPFKEKKAASRPVDDSLDGWKGGRFSFSSDWVVGLFVASGAIGILAARHIRFRPTVLSRNGANSADPPLEFISKAEEPGEIP